MPVGPDKPRAAAHPFLPFRPCPRVVDFLIPPKSAEVRERFARFVTDVAIPAEREGVVDGAIEWKVVEELRSKARAAGLWAPHLPAEWGGLELSTVEMALVSEELGRSPLAPYAVNCAAPDEGNMHTLLLFGTDAQRERWLRPLAEGRIRSCFAMTEKDAGSDPSRLKAVARRDGSGWRVEGTKVFVTGAAGAAFSVVVALTSPERGPKDGASLLLVAAPAFEVVREIPVSGTHAPGGHCEIRFARAAGEILGREGAGLAHAQARLAHGRVGHAMRWIGAAQRALDLAATRALERETFGSPLAERQAVQWMLAESAIELRLSRLVVLHAAWKLDAGLDARQEVAVAKVHVAQSLGRITDRAIQVWGGLGVSEDLPLARLARDARAARIYDGPDEVHLASIARSVLKEAREKGTTRGATGGFP